MPMLLPMRSSLPRCWQIDVQTRRGIFDLDTDTVSDYLIPVNEKRKMGTEERRIVPGPGQRSLFRPIQVDVSKQGFEEPF